MKSISETWEKGKLTNHEESDDGIDTPEQQQKKIDDLIERVFASKETY